MMMDIASRFAKLSPDVGKQLVYVDYLEAAPWNVRPLTDKPRLSGVGVVLMRAAVQLSIDEGFRGRLGLHSLPQAEEFYRDKCGMRFLENDPHYEDLPYYEFSRKSAKTFVEAVRGGVT